MNFLAHAYLSFGHKGLLVGNMISDFVKGKTALLHFPVEVQSGILLHRNIDCFTDSHAVTKKAKEVFRPSYRLFSGAIVDIVFDHFLANDQSIFPPHTLLPFTREVYEVLEEFSSLLPLRFVQVFAYMKTENWLYHYHQVSGIEKTLRGLIRRTSYLEDSTEACALFLRHYDFLQACYQEFFAELKAYALQESQLMRAGDV